MPIGRKPTATAQKKLYGNPGKRALNKDEPQPKLYDKLPEPPEWLGSYGVAEWRRAGKILLDLGLLSDADMLMFGAYCQNVHMLITASINVSQNGFTIKGARGEVKNPAVSSFQTATTALRSLASEFGMTPASRTRFKSPVDDEETFEEIMNAGADNSAEDAD